MDRFSLIFPPLRDGSFVAVALHATAELTSSPFTAIRLLA